MYMCISYNSLFSNYLFRKKEKIKCKSKTYVLTIIEINTKFNHYISRSWNII